MKEIPTLSPEQKKEIGPLINSLQNELKTKIESSKQNLASCALSELNLDLTYPVKSDALGYLHPTTQVIREMNEFFKYHGFSIVEGPEIEEAEYNFRRLNLPEGHPATDLQDTLFVHEPSILLRTHTSSVESRILTDYEPPIRAVVPGKVFRNETASASNLSFFHQYQGFVVDKGITIQHLKTTLTLFHQFLFGDDVVLRFRYKYYPEVSPGMGIDMQCSFCHGDGCAVCKQRGWLEVLGSGMIHYNTLKACGIDPDIYTGYAFGMGLDRLVMAKFGLNDGRKLYNGEMVYR
jgi:phenylalanyl-tRNA synthetase alpha chain